MHARRCCWHRDQPPPGSVAAAASPTVLHCSRLRPRIKGSVAIELHGFASFHAASLPKLPHHSKADGEEQGQQRHAFLYVRILMQHCMSARSHAPSFYLVHSWICGLSRLGNKCRCLGAHI
ncbi:hypothetical protein J3F84DRAFT_156283 [Trichoderma pleuroticola]